MNKSIDFYYFTGTGNTLSIVKKMKKTFENRDLKVSLFKIERVNPSKVDTRNTLGLAFPVAAASTFPLVWNFLNKLPETDATEVFMVDTYAGSSGAIVGPLKNILTEKGYKCIGAKEIRMPCNIFYVFSEKTNNRLIEKGLNKAEEYAKSILDRTARWGRIPFFSDIMYYVSLILLSTWKIKWSQRLFLYKLIRERCTKCGICAKICPVGNIKMEEFPKYTLNCQYCMRCVSFCPEKALIVPFNFKNRTLKSVDIKEIIE